jgi:hypothetical protein
VEGELRGRADDLVGLLGVVMPGSCTRIVVALPGDVRFGDPEAVDPLADQFDRSSSAASRSSGRLPDSRSGS